jgi:transcriptional regulator with XRE-family HTH domain
VTAFSLSARAVAQGATTQGNNGGGEWYRSLSGDLGREATTGGQGDTVSISESMVGERLRSIRRQKGLSLHDVEARSGMEFKASVLGAYERGERAISVPRLLRLAEIYQVPGDQLLPRRSDVDTDLTQRDNTFEEGFTIDLERLRDLDDPEASVLSRYAETIQLQRQDFNGRLLTIRRDDLRVLAAVLGRRAEDLGRRLDELGLRAGT